MELRKTNWKDKMTETMDGGVMCEFYSLPYAFLYFSTFFKEKTFLNFKIYIK